MLTLNNVQTQDTYQPVEVAGAATLESFLGGLRLVYTVANASVFAQFRPIKDPGSEAAEYGPEVLLTPQQASVERISAVRFRSAVAGSAARIVAQLSEPGDILPSQGNPFTGQLAASGAVGAGVGVYDRVTSLLDVNGTNLETDIYNKTIKAVDVVANSWLRFRMSGDWLHNNVAGDTVTVRAYIGATKVYDSGATAIGGTLSAIRHPWRMDGDLVLLSALNSEWTSLGFSVEATPAAAPTTGEGVLGSGQGLAPYGLAAASGVSFAADQVFRVTVQWSAAAANNSWRRYAALLELL